MKRKILIIIALLAALVPCAAESGSYFGARLGMDVNVPAGSGNHYKVGAGFDVGAIYHYNFAKNFFVEPGLKYYYNAMSNERPVDYGEFLFDGSAQFMGLRVPVYVGYSFNASDNLEIGIATGPTVNFNLSAKQKLDPNFEAPIPVPTKSLNLFEHGYKRVDALWGLRLSFTFAHSYYIGIDGEVSFTPLAVYGNKDKKIRIHRNTVALTLGYNF